MKRFTAIIALFTVFFNIASAQLTSSERGEKPYVPTWNTYEFMKYGNIGASLYTGTINYSIPIFEYKDDDFNYTVSIDYATNGFRVNHKSGHLGHGWSLSSPGMITREIHGIADEAFFQVSSPRNNGIKVEGYNKISGKTLNKDIMVHRFNERYFAVIQDTTKSYYDAQPDIYRFNFCGYTGAFRRNPLLKGKPSFVLFDCIPRAQSLRIDSISDDNETIVFIDGAGYKYTFCPGEYKKEPQDYAYDPILVKRILQWKLSKITAPNNRHIDFIYSDFGDYNYSVNDCVDRRNHEITYTPTLSYNHHFISGIISGDHSADIDIIAHDMYANRLERIIFADNTCAEIKYVDGIKEVRHKSINGTLDTVFDNCKKISQILIKSDSGKLLKKSILTYKTIGRGKPIDNKLTFLESINISGSGKFSFDYYTMTSCPALGTIKSDHWGYYNGENGGFDKSNFFNNLKYDNKYNESYTSSFNRKPDFRSALSGCLSKISYPTGGYSLLSYEPHDCSKKVVRNDSTSFRPMLISLNHNEAIGGIRIKEIITFMSDNQCVDTVRYEYKNTSLNSLSSGTLIHSPRYGVQYIVDLRGICPEPLKIKKSVQRYNLCNNIYDYNSTHIEYSQVREFKSSRGYKDYFFSNFSDFPDAYDIQGNGIPFGLNTLIAIGDSTENFIDAIAENQDNLITNLLTPYASLQTKRGLMTATYGYDISGKLQSYAEFNYKFPLIQTDSILTLTGDIAQDILYPRYNIELLNTEESMILDNTKVSNKKTSEYNAFGMEKRSESTSSEGLTIIDEYQYSGDCSNDDADIIVGRMLRAHNVNSLLLHQRKVLINGSEVVIGKTRYNYYQPDLNNNSLFKVKSVETWTPSKGWSVKETYVHDECGRVVQLTDSSGVSTSYLWGYKGRYPLMKVKNASFNQLKNMVSTTGLILGNLTECSDYDDTTFDKLLASTSHFLRSQPEVYKFMPNIGLSELTLPNSLKSFYSYDGYGRLTSVSDSKQNIIQRGEYNLVSIAPLTANLSCTDSYVDEPVNVIATADGATHTYRYTFSLLDTSDNRKVYEYSCNDGVFNVIPLKTSIASNHYKLECVVEDSISGERVSLCQDIYLKPVVLHFTDINELSDINGNKILTANIFTDTPTSATFILDLTATGNCTVKIGKTSVSTAPCKEKAIRIPLEPGDNQIFISYPSTISIFEVTLQLKEATNDHEVGEPNQLSVTV